MSWVELLTCWSLLLVRVRFALSSRPEERLCAADLTASAINNVTCNPRLFPFEPNNCPFQLLYVISNFCLAEFACAEEKAGSLRQSLFFDCLDDVFELINIQRNFLAFVQAVGKRLYDVSVKVGMLAPVAE